jgi:hypothetical protein
MPASFLAAGRDAGAHVQGQGVCHDDRRSDWLAVNPRMRSYARRLRRHVYDLPDGNTRMLRRYCAYGICKAKVMLQVDGQNRMQVCYLHAPAGVLLLMRENPDRVVAPDFSLLTKTT